MRLLLGTHSGLYEARPSDDFKAVGITHITDDFTYGLTATPAGVIVGHADVDYKTRYEDRIYGGERGHLVLYDPDALEPEDILVDDDLYDLHQIDSAAGFIYAANTGLNALTAIRISDGERWDFILGDADISDPRDANHLNSVDARYTPPFGVLLTLVFHNSKKKPSEIIQAAHVPGASNLSMLGSLQLPHEGVHNALPDTDRGAVYYCGSQNGVLARYDVDDSSVHELAIGDVHGEKPAILADDTVAEDLPIVVGWHTKALAKVGDYLLVGCSEHVQRVGRFDSRAKIAVVDLNGFYVWTEIELGEIGNLNEILVLDEGGESTQTRG